MEQENKFFKGQFLTQFDYECELHLSKENEVKAKTNLAMKSN